MASKGLAIENAMHNSFKPAPAFDFSDVANGTVERLKPEYCEREDGQALFYHGKENAIYGETESGKDMLLALTTIQALDDGCVVYWIEFEESDGIDAGLRLMQMGIDVGLLCDQNKFHFVAPEDLGQVRGSVLEATDNECDIVILNGIQAAYSLFGWEITSPESTSKFRELIVRPCLDAGCTIIETDHMNKASAESRGNGSRYASGGVAKLNWVSGAAYRLVPVSTITLGGSGSSRLMLSKDRPSGVKSGCVPTGEPRTMYAGMMTVKSSRSIETVLKTKKLDGNTKKYEQEKFSLQVSIIPPQPGDAVTIRPGDVKLNIGSGSTQTDIDDVLKDGPATVAKIAEVTGMTTSAIRGALHRGAKRGKYRKLSGDKWEMTS